MAGSPPARPLEDAEFDRLMAAFAPFEDAPRVAVAVSGGPDSMALMLLAARWAERRGGSAVGLTVDHRLRPESGAEARQVGRWLGARGIAHHILRRRGARPTRNVQAEARAVRYRLLRHWCARHGCLHLLVAHNREDQAETVLIRLARGSGVDGLSAMSATVFEDGHRVLRPLLDVPRARLAATLDAAGQDSIDDPSNRSQAFLRPRLRRELAAVEGAADGLAQSARRLAGERIRMEAETARLAAAHVTLRPEGYALVERGALAGCDGEAARRLLARVLVAVGGRDYMPRAERLEALLAHLHDGTGTRARTLGGCRVIAAGDRLLFCREPAAAESPVAIGAGGRVRWDGRFDVSLGREIAVHGPASVGCLGDDGWREVVGRASSVRDLPVPAAVRATLPAVREGGVIRFVPHLVYGRTAKDAATVGACKVTFLARQPLVPPAFQVARAPG